MKEGTIKLDKEGRTYVYLPNHPNSDKLGFIFRSRLVMEKKLGRYLTSKEVVHHLDHNFTNDNIENLYLFKDLASHLKHHMWLRRMVKKEAGLYKTSKEKQKEWYANNVDVVKKKNHNTYLRNKESVLKRTKAYQKKNKVIVALQHHNNYIKNKERIKVRDKAYRENNKDKLKVKGHNYYEKNKNKHRKFMHEWYFNHQPKMKEYREEYYLKNKEEILRKNKLWKQKNRESYLLQQREYSKNRKLKVKEERLCKKENIV